MERTEKTLDGQHLGAAMTGVLHKRRRRFTLTVPAKTYAAIARLALAHRVSHAAIVSHLAQVWIEADRREEAQAISDLVVARKTG